jgi:hypothetical protein
MEENRILYALPVTVLEIVLADNIKKERDMQCMYDVTLRRVRVTVVVVEQ